ncbi:hypothetical protein NIIDMKKI_62320 [Mycobacterium kansasii]|uniref:Lipoantigen family protein n=1 Tax=Mycobacterium kansasii TaxID=1768 RepID=A0A7G1IJ14_MYCKA|nr:hypothetical protein NIIDMKKI_62320 [Mycobacterium kansasii]
MLQRQQVRTVIQLGHVVQRSPEFDIGARVEHYPGSSRTDPVIIGGQPQNVSGPVVCSTNAGRFSIAVGDMATGIIVGLEPDGSVVHSAGLGTVDGVVMSFTEGVPDENASATKTDNSYHITGVASGVDNAGQQVHKPFEVDVTCP